MGKNLSSYTVFFTTADVETLFTVILYIFLDLDVSTSSLLRR